MGLMPDKDKKILLFKSGLFRRYLFSYVVILGFVIFVMGMYLYDGFVKALTEEVKNTTFLTLSQSVDIIERYIKNLNYLAVRLPQNQNLRPFLYGLDGITEYDYYKLLHSLKDYRAINAYIDNIFIYFRDKNVIVSAEGKYDVNVFYDYVFRYEGMSQTDLIDMLNNVEGKVIYPIKTVFSGRQKKKLLTYLQSIPIMETKHKATLLMSLDAISIEKIISNVLSNYKGNVFIIDEKGNSILSLSYSDLGLEEEEVLNLIGRNKSGVYTKNINDKEMVISYLKAPDTGWSYIVIIPSEQVLIKVNRMRNWAYFIITLITIIGISLSWWFSHGNYKPIKSIIKRLMNCFETKKEAKTICKDELEVINGLITSIVSRSKILEKNFPLIKANFLLKLLKGSYRGLNEIKEMANLVQIEFTQGPFAVMVFSIDDYIDLAEANPQAILEVFQFAVSNVAEELCSEYGRGNTVNISDNSVAMIIDFQNKKFNYKENMFLIGSKAIEFFSNNFEFTITVGIGNVYYSIKDIWKSFLEARTAVDYKIIKGKNTVIMYDEVIINSNERYYYTVQNENIIINALKIGDFNKINEVLSEIFDIITKRPISVKFARCIYFGVVNTAMKALAELKLEDYNGIINISDSLPDLLKCETLPELFEETRRYYATICKQIKKINKNISNELVHEIFKYVKENFDDPNISLTLLAEKFNLTITYLSRLFRREVNCTFTEYIHRMRIEKAKHLLLMTDRNIADIGLECGYINVHSFIRSFKKYEGITPGQFRELHVLR